MATVNLNRQGFTLIEVMVALLIMAIGLLASLAGIMTAVNYNLGNDLRNEALKIAQEQQEAVRSMPYINVAPLNGTNQTIQRQFGKAQRDFVLSWITQPTVLGGNNVQRVTLTVSWALKNKAYSYVSDTLVRQTK